MTKDFFESVDVVVAQKLVGNLILLIRTLERSPSRSLHTRFLNRVCEVACVCVGVVSCSVLISRVQKVFTV